MHPLTSIDIFGKHFELPTLLGILLCYFLFASAWTILKFKNKLSPARLCAIALLTFIFSIYGARLFHAWLENPILFTKPLDLLTRFDGMVFYGAMFFGLISYALASRWLAGKLILQNLMDHAALVVSLGYGVIRLGCLFQGCCWGKITDLPWAITSTNPLSANPLTGLPLHPVQIYDSLSGFVAFGILCTLLRNPTHSGKGLFYLLTLLGAGRFLTEFFRGDDFRGLYFSGMLSTSQILSLFIFSIGTFCLYPKKTLTILGKSFVFALAALLIGCKIDIQAPPPDLFHSTTITLAKQKLQSVSNPSFKDHKRGFILVMADATLQGNYQNSLRQHFPKTKSVEELAWWMSAKSFSESYSQGLILTGPAVNIRTLMLSIDQYEMNAIDYDLYFLVHGIPNYYSTGKQTFFSWKILQQLQVNKLKGLDLVFSNSCYGSSLATDWIKAGAKTVISFPNENKNLFWFFEFLKNLPQGNKQAFHETNLRFKTALDSSLAYRKALEIMNLDYKNDPSVTAAPEFFYLNN